MARLIEYPTPECSRLTPVPARDVSWRNESNGKVLADFGRSELPLVQLAQNSRACSVYTVVKEELVLADSSKFPSASQFNAARAEIKDGVFPARLKSLDDKLLGNHVGYSIYTTGVDYYFTENLCCKKSARFLSDFKFCVSVSAQATGRSEVQWSAVQFRLDRARVDVQFAPRDYQHICAHSDAQPEDPEWRQRVPACLS